MNQPFTNILNSSLKNLYNQAMDAMLSDNGLSVKCSLRYTGANNITYCNNCIIDSISLLSSNKYNNNGPQPFEEGSICPVCMGVGQINSLSSIEIVNMICIFDSKYWLNWSSKTLNIPNNMVQTICGIDLLPKVRNAKEIIIDNNLAQYGNYIYERAGDPEPVGLDPHQYIITMWKRK